MEPSVRSIIRAEQPPGTGHTKTIQDFAALLLSIFQRLLRIIISCRYFSYQGMAARMMRLLDNLQYKAAINRHIHHDAYKVLAVLIPDSVQQLPALFKFRLQFMDLFAKQIHGITISFIQALKLIIP